VFFQTNYNIIELLKINYYIGAESRSGEGQGWCEPPLEFGSNDLYLNNITAKMLHLCDKES